MASAKCCQRRERRLLNDIRHVASGLVHRIRHRPQYRTAAGNHHLFSFQRQALFDLRLQAARAGHAG